MPKASWFKRLSRLFAGERSSEATRLAEAAFPRLYPIRLEDRQVLDGVPLVQLDVQGMVTVTAGADANDGKADAFEVSKVETDSGSILLIKINDKTAAEFRYDDVRQLRVEGSQDEDTLVIDADAVPTGGLDFVGNAIPGVGSIAGGVSGPDRLIIQGLAPPTGGSPSSTTGPATGLGGTNAGATAPLTYQIGTNSGSVATADGSWQVAFQDVEQVIDRLSVDDRQIDVSAGLGANLRGGDLGTGWTTIEIVGGPTLETRNALESLGVTATSITVSGHVDLSGADARLTATESLTVASSGQLLSGGGQLELSAPQMLIAGVVDVGAGGTAALDVGSSGVMIVSGTIRAVGAGDGQTGGTISLRGDFVRLQPTARLDATGDAGGGLILVGSSGDTAVDPEVGSRGVWIELGAVVDASAVRAGDGGRVIVWGTEGIVVDGLLRATGGSESGDGGFVDTSTRGGFSLTAAPVVTAPMGQGGTWLIDPYDLEIVAAAGSAGFTPTDANPLFTFTSDSTHSQLGIATLLAAMGNGITVELKTGTDMGSPDAGNITLSTDLDFNGKGTGTLKLTAHHSIILNNQIYDSDTMTADSLSIVLSAGNDALGTSSTQINADVATRGGAFTSTGNNFTLAPAKSIQTAGGAISVTTAAGNVITVNGALNAGAGSLTLTADDLVLAGGPDSIVGTGVVTLQPLTAGTMIGIAGGAGAFSLTTPDLMALADGFSQIVIGRADGTGGIDLMAATFRDPVLLRSPMGGTINVDGTLTGTGNASIEIDGSGTTTVLSANVVTDGATITFSDNVIVDAAVLIDSTNGNTFSGGANISFLGTVNATAAMTAESLNVTAGTTGDVSFSGAVGGTQPLDLLNVTADVVAFSSTVAVAGPLTVVSNGTASFHNTVTTSTASGNVLLTNTGLLTIASGATFTLSGTFNQNGGGNVSLGADILTANKTISFSSPVTLTKSVVLNSNNAVGTGANITLNDDVIGTDAMQTLTLTAGSAGDISAKALGTGTGLQRLGGLTITSADTVTATSIATAGGLTSTSNKLTVTGATNSWDAPVVVTANFSGAGNAVTLDDVDTHGQDLTISSADSISFTGGANSVQSSTLGGSFTIQGTTVGTTLGLGTGATAAVTMNDASIAAIGIGFTGGIFFGQAGQTGQITLRGGNHSYDQNVTIRADGGAMVDLGAVLNTTAGGAVNKSIAILGAASSVILLDQNIVTAGGTITIVGDTEISTALVVDSTNAGAAVAGADIEFQGTVNAAAVAATETLTVRAGTAGDVTFTGVVVVDQALDAINVTGHDVEFMDRVTVAGPLTVTSSGTTAFDNTVTTTTGTGNVVLTNTGLLTIANGATFTLSGTFNQNGAGSVSLGADVKTANKTINFSSPVTLTNSVVLNSNNVAGTGATITLGGAVAGTDAMQTLTLTAGSAGNISAQALGMGTDLQRLGGLTITSANTVTAASIATAGGLTSTSSKLTVTGATNSWDSPVNITASFSGVGSAVTLDAVDTHGQDLTISSADAISFTGGANSVKSSTTGGSFTVQGTAVGTTLGLGTGAAGAVPLDDAAIAAIGTGFTGGIFFGRVGQTGQITVRGPNHSYDQNVTLRATGGATVDLGAALNTTEGGALNKSVSILGSGVSNILLGGNIATAGGAITVVGVTKVSAAVLVDSTNAGGAAAGADIEFQGTVNAANVGATETLTVKAGTMGDVTFTGTVGNVTGLDALEVSGHDVEFMNTVAVAGPLTVISTGTTMFDNTVTTTTAAGDVLLTNTGLLTVASGANFSLSGSFNQNGAGGVLLGANVKTAGKAISFSGDLQIDAAVQVDSTNGNAVPAGANVQFLGTVNATSAMTAESLTVTAGTTGDVTFSGAVGGMQALDFLDVSGDIVTANAITMGAGPLTFTANDLVLAGGADSIVGTGVVTLQPLTAATTIGIAGGAGTFTLTTSDLDTLADGFSQIIIGRADGTGAITILATTFRDPVLLRSPLGGVINVDGTLTGADNASLTFRGAATLSANVVTSGNLIKFENNVVVDAAVSVDSTNANTTPTGGNIQFLGTVNATAAMMPESLTVNAGTMGDVTFTAAVGGTQPLDSLVVSADVLTAAAISVGSGSLTLTANDLVLSGGPNSLVGTGVVTLQPLDPAASIGVSGGAGTFSVSSADLATLADGFSQIVIGRADGTGTITILTTTFRDPVLLRSPLGGMINVDGPLTGTGNASFTFQGLTTLSANVVTSGGLIKFENNVLADAAVQLDTTNGNTVPAGGSVEFLGTLDATAAMTAESLTVTAGTTGDVTFSAAVGGMQALDFLSVSGDIVTANAISMGAGPLTFTANDLVLAGGPDSIVGTGVVTLQPLTAATTIGLGGGAGAFSLSSADLATLADGFSQIVIGRVDGTGGMTILATTFRDPVLLRSPSGGVIDVDGTLTGTDNASLTFRGAATLSANVVTSGNLIKFENNVVVDAAVLVDSTNANTTPTGGNIQFLGTLNATAAMMPESLTVRAGTMGDATFTGAVGNSQRPDALDVNAGNVVFTSTVAVAGPLTVVSSGTTSFNDAVSTTGAAGDVLLTNSGLLTIASGATFTLSGSFTQNGAGNVSLGANVLTPNRTIRFSSPVTLTNSVLLNSNNAIGTGADITLSGAVTGTNATQILTLTAGSSGDILAQALGTGAGNQRLGGLSITAADDVTATSIATAGGLTTTSNTLKVTGATNSWTSPVTITVNHSGGGNALQLDDVDTHGQDLTISSAGVVSFTGGAESVQSSTLGGMLTIQGTAVGTTLGLGSGAAGDVQLIDSSIAAIGPGFTGGIFFGRAGQMGQVTLLGAEHSYDQNVTVRANGGATVDLGTTLSTTEGGATGKSVSILGGVTSVVRLGGDITTAGGLITVAGVTQVNADVLVDSTNGNATPAGANVSFQGTVNAAGLVPIEILTVKAGTAGDVTFTGTVGSVLPLDALDVTGDIVQFTNTVAVAGPLTVVSAGATTFSNAVTTTGAAGNVLLTNTGLLTIASGATFTPSGSFTQNGAGNVSLGASVLTPNQTISFSSPITLTSSVVLNSNNAIGTGADITLVGAVIGTNATQALTLTAGAGGDISAAALGSGTGLQRLGGLSVTSADEVLASSIATAGGLTTTSNRLTVTGATNSWNAPVTITVNHSGAGNALQLDAVDTHGQDLTISSAGLVAFTGGADTVQSSTVGGKLTLQGTTVGTTLGLGTGAAGDVRLNDTSIAAIGPGFSGGIFFGGAGQTGQVTLRGTQHSYDQSVTIRADGGATVDLGAALSTTEGGATNKAVSILGDATSVVRLGGDITTARGIITVTGSTQVRGSVLVDSTNGNASPTGADITFQGSVNGAGLAPPEILTVKGGTTGDVTFTGTVGSAQSLSALDVSGDIIHAKAIQMGTGPITLTANDLALTGGPDSIAGSGVITLQPLNVAASIGLSGAAGSFGLSSADLATLADGFSQIVIGSANGSGGINVATTTFDDPVLLRTPLGGAISGPGTLIGESLTMVAGTGVFGTATTSPLHVQTPELQAVTLISGDVRILNTFAGPVTLNEAQANAAPASSSGSVFYEQQGGGELLIAGDVQATKTGGVSSGSVSIETDGDITIGATLLTEGNGTISVNAGGDLTIVNGGKIVVGSETMTQGVVTNIPPATPSGTPESYENGTNVSDSRQAQINSIVGTAGELGFVVTIDWGVPASDNPPNVVVTNMVPGGAPMFSHQYTLDQSVELPVTFDVMVTVDMDHRISLTANGQDLTVSPTTLIPMTTGTFFSFLQVIPTAVAATPRVVVPTLIRPQLIAQSTLVVANRPTETSSVSISAPSVQNRQFVLRIVLAEDPDKKQDTIADLDLGENDLNDLPGLFKKLPDGHYQIWLKLEDGSSQLVKDFFIRDGKAIDLDDLSPDGADVDMPMQPSAPVRPAPSSESSRDSGFDERRGSSERDGAPLSPPSQTGVRPAIEREAAIDWSDRAREALGQVDDRAFSKARRLLRRGSV